MAAGIKASADGLYGTLQVNSADVVTFNSSGNVGIGTLAPRSKFASVSGTDNTAGGSDPSGFAGGFVGATGTANQSTLSVESNDTIAANTGGSIGLGGRYNSTSWAQWAKIGALKNNATSGDYGGALAFYTRANGASNTEKMRIDSSGNVGIGTSTPGTKLQVAGAVSIQGTAGFPSSGVGIELYYDTTNGSHLQSYDRTSSAWKTLNINSNLTTFATAGSERMRIDSSGNLLVGATAPTNAGKVISFFNSTTNVGFVSNDTSATAGATYFIASNNGTNIGSIARVGATSAVAYNTTSDQRLKSNITDSNSVLPTLMDVRVRQFDWTEGEVHQDYGFIAQELESTLSGVVTKGKTEDDMWQIDYARLTPHLVKAIQELKAIVDAQAVEIAALKAI